MRLKEHKRSKTGKKKQKRKQDSITATATTLETKLLDSPWLAGQG
jgi:hypothetical protein